jgi:hypothetical protein
MTKRILTICGLAAAFSATVSGQGMNLKAGLWEATSTMSMGGGAPMIPEDKLAQMPPAQRAQVEAMMKNAMNTTTKLCYTQEQLNRGLNYNNDRAGTCKSNIVSIMPSKQVSEVSCDSGKTKTTGTVTMEALDKEHYNGNVKMHTEGNGPPRDITMKLAGKWLSSDCGDVKPLDYGKFGK